MSQLMQSPFIVSMKCASALPYEGMAVKLTGAGTVDVAGAGEPVFGVALKTTEDPFVKGTYLTNQYVDVMRMGRAKVALAFSQTIVVGDRLISAAGGYGTKFTATAWPGTYASATATTIENEKSAVIGFALEAKTTGASDHFTCDCWIEPRKLRHT